MADKQLGCGTILKLDHDNDNAYDAMTLVEDITLPPEIPSRAEAVELTDKIIVPVLGPDETSEFEFNQYWHPGDTEHEKLDTHLNTPATRNTPMGVQVVTPHATPVTIEFQALVAGLTKPTITNRGYYKRTVTMIRTTPITRT